MSFGFRKGFISGPFRMTHSKSGVSMSVGAGAARLTTGPRGTRVSYSKGGFYYRSRLDATPRRSNSPQIPPAQRELEGPSHPAAAPPADTTLTKTDPNVPPPKTASQPSGVASAFLLLGLQPGASSDEASAAYKSLAAQNHPDKVAHMAPEFRELAERKMRELNAAYDQIRAFYQQRP